MPSLQCWLVVAGLAWLSSHLALELDVANMEIPDEKGDNSDSADNSGDCFGSDNSKSVTSNQLLIVNIIHHETAELQWMSSKQYWVDLLLHLSTRVNPFMGWVVSGWGGNSKLGI